MVAAFEKLGYTRRRGKGSHVHLTKAGSLRLTIPLHHELGVKLVLNEIKKSGISVEDFLKAL
ncbi:MAG: type II toxin-antitoxin system HicA family toxin [Dehalococcoidia bacterium]|nr:type II toxin-antitoxin system HicA family toxin [Dehalococcoidia bacterium]